MQIELGTEKFNVDLILTTYKDSDRLAVQFVVKETEEPFCTLSVNLPDQPLPGPEYFWAKTWSENAPIRNQLLNSGFFEDTGQRAPTGFARAELWKLTVEKALDS